MFMRLEFSNVIRWNTYFVVASVITVDLSPNKVDLLERFIVNETLMKIIKNSKNKLNINIIMS